MGCLAYALVVLIALSGLARAQSIPALRTLDPGRADGVDDGRVEHRIIPGERLADVAERYGVSPEDVAADNGLDRERPRLRVGQVLRVRAVRVPPPRQRVVHLVRFGDNWDAIGARYGVTRTELRTWNPDVPRGFVAGQELVVWVDGDPPPPPVPGGLEPDRDIAGLSLAPVATGGESLGQPARGRLRGGVRMPENPALYRLRRPDYAYGSTHTVTYLQRALARFKRDHDYARPVTISDMSRARGGPFARHSSHQSGRDADVWLPTVPELDPDAHAVRASDVDWAATWALVKALIKTGEVQYIFLSRARQRHLYRAALADGFDKVALGELIQYPRRAQTAVVRHAAHHDKHMHVRFRCASHERRCR